MSYKGFFKPINKDKYLGDSNNIVYRSSWELKLCMWFDHNNKVEHWSSESIVVPYVSPVDREWHNYYVDFFVEFKDGRKYLIEVKPEKETKPPTATTNRRRLIKESVTYAKNRAKWGAAQAYAEERGWKFRILTERNLFGR